MISYLLAKLRWEVKVIFKKNMEKKAKKENGSVVVEFALILPLFLLIVFSIVELSVALYNKAVITNASREAARAGVVVRSKRLTDSQIKDKATAYIENKLISFKSATPTVTVDSSGGVSGTNLTVTVTYPYKGLGLGTLLSAISTRTVNLTATTIMVNE